MDVSKRIQNNLALILLFFYLSIFPLGQLLKVQVDLFGIPLKINISDLIVLLYIPIYFLNEFNKPNIYSSINDFIWVCSFSLIFSLNYFTFNQVIYGSIYIFRFISYFYFFVVVRNLVNTKSISKQLLLNSLLAVSICTSILGWIQYIFIPDITFLKYLNWDDHLYRLAGTFLDPTFTALIIVFGIIIAVMKEYKNFLAKVLMLSFLIVSLVFTYSRASYIALLVGVGILIVKNIRSMWFIKIAMVILIMSLLVLPKKASEGTLLYRTRSVYAKVDNYSETFQIIKKYPIFGIGFNNLCSERIETFGGDPSSHACSGSDSSILFVFATTGIIGLLIFLNMIVNIFQSIDVNNYGKIFLSCGGALLVHSAFVQSAFYPFAMGFMGIMFATALKTKE